MNKLFTKIVGAALGLTMAIGVGVAVGSNSKEATPVHATESVYKTALFGSSYNSKGVQDYTSTWTSTNNGFTVSLTNFNNNNNGWSSVKCGRKSNASTGTITTSSAIDKKITKVDLGIAAIAYPSNLTSITLYKSSNNSTWTSLGTFTKSTGTQTVTIAAANQATNLDYKLEFVCTGASKNGVVEINRIDFYHEASTPLTGITLSGTEVGGTSPNYTLANIAKSDTSTNHTVSVGLTPNTATDQVVKVEHHDGDSVVDVYSSPVTCTSGTGSFNVRAKGTAVGTERLKIYGNTQTSVIRYLSVTVYDDSVTNWTVSFNSDGGASIADMTVEDGDTFEFPSPGTKTHYSFDGWSSDGGDTLYAAGVESPAVDDDIEYTAYWTQDAQTTVIYKSGDGTGSDISSTEYAGSYSLASFPGTWSAPSGKAFSKWSDGSSQYSAGANYTLVGNTTVTFTAVYKTVDEYTLFSGALVEGDYVICSGTKAMKNEITSSPRIDVADVTVTNNKIVDPDASIIWHIAQDGDYWTIYNAAVEKYAAFTGTNGRGTLIDSVTDYARFSTEDSYEFINVGNSGKYLRYNPTYGFASYSTSTGVSLTLYKAPSNELDSVTTSGQNTSFTAGIKWSYGGTLTAHYTLEADAAVTPTSFKFGDSGINPTTAGTPITTDTTLNHDTHNGKYIYVIYTENNITKYCSYQITVNYAAVTSVVIDTHAAEIGLNETYNYTLVGVTVNSSYADQGYEWIVHANTVSDDYTFDGSGLKSKDHEGTITLWCRSTADNSKYDELVVTVTGNPTAEFTPASVSGYVGKGTSVAFTYGNMDDTSKISVTASPTGKVTIGAITASEGNGSVAIIFSAAGSTTLSISYDGGAVLDTVGVTVSADSVTSVTWSATNIDVFSGATLDTTGWNVQYEMASGDSGSASSYTIKLGSATVTAGYEFEAADNGKTMHVEYGGVSSSSITVTVTQTINNVYAETYTEDTWSHTISATTWTDAYGEKTLNGKAWTTACSAGAYWGYDATKGQQFGKGADPCASLTLSSSAFSGTVSTVKVTTSGASSVVATLGVTVGGTAFKSGGSESVSISATSTEYTFTGSGSGTITITWTQTSSKALYLKALSVTTLSSSGQQQIANNASHKAAQRAAVAFAQAFNTAMDTTSNCTTNMSSAWSACSSAYTSFCTAAAALGSTEEAYAKNLIKFATAQYSDDSAEACIERMMKTYEICVQKHGQTPFMSDLVTLGAPQVSPLVNIIGENNNTVAIIVIISMVSMTAIGGYFFLRKRKENN